MASFFNGNLFMPSFHYFPPGRRPYGPEANWGETPKFFFKYQIFLLSMKIFLLSIKKELESYLPLW